jgi:1,4-dihydroxy-2-naphthoate octaprenyltransferase
MNQDAIRPGSPAAWLLASRPATLTAAIVPVLVGAACAAALGGFALGPALAALLGACFIQIGTNFANDVFDYEKGADTEARLGPTRAAQAGLITPRGLRAGMVVAFGLATLAGVYLVWVAGPWVLAIGVASILSGVAYTGGPYPLGYNGLGDVFVLVFFGFVAVCGTVFVQMGSVPSLAFLASVPVGCLATAILVVNNLRDAEGDAQVGKRTLAVRLGVGAVRGEYVLLLALAYGVPLLLPLLHVASSAAALPLLSLPLAVPLVRSVYRDRGRALNATLAKTARLLLVHGALFAAGLAVGP